jgi:hypothetical protein
MSEVVEVVAQDGATQEQIALQVHSMTSAGRMALVFPSAELMRRWLDRRAARAILPPLPD